MGTWDHVNMMGWGSRASMWWDFICALKYMHCGIFQFWIWEAGVVLALLIVMEWEGRGRTLIFF